MYHSHPTWNLFLQNLTQFLPSFVGNGFRGKRKLNFCKIAQSFRLLWENIIGLFLKSCAIILKVLILDNWCTMLISCIPYLPHLLPAVVGCWELQDLVSVINSIIPPWNMDQCEANAAAILLSELTAKENPLSNLTDTHTIQWPGQFGRGDHPPAGAGS